MSELEEQTHPEILRSNLANTVLALVKLGIYARHHYVSDNGLVNTGCSRGSLGNANRTTVCKGLQERYWCTKEDR
jgi:hypothetical protein